VITGVFPHGIHRLSQEAPVHQTQEYRAILATDIERSSGRGMIALRAIRETLQSELREAAGQSGIDWDACLRIDSGDGMHLIVPSDVPKARLVYPLLRELATRLRAHNRLAGPPAQVRVRLALHAGDVDISPRGTVSGPPLEVTARMLDAAEVKSALKASPDASLAALLSPHFYDETVPHGYPGIEAGDFRKVSVAVKNYTGDAWLCVPHTGNQPGGGQPKDAGEPSDRFSMTNSASRGGVVNAVQHGSLYVGGSPARPEERP